MSAVHLITGYAGSEHIQSADDGAFNAAFFGSGQYVMESGSEFEGSIIDNNTVRILDGDLLMYGRHVRIEPGMYEDLTVETGTAGKNRLDLICMTYEKNANDGTESAFLEVIKGEEVVENPVLPSYTDGNILEGAVKNQMPLYIVKVEGVVLSGLQTAFVTIPTYKSLAEQYAAQFEKSCKTYLGALNILDTMEEVNANTLTNQLAGALSVKELFNNTLGKTSKTVTLPYGEGWYRVGISSVNIHSRNGIIQIYASGSGYHIDAIMAYSLAYHNEPSLNQISCRTYGTSGLTKMRIVYPTNTYANNYAYLEVYKNTYASMTLNMLQYGLNTLTLTDTTSGAIPELYTSKDFTFTSCAMIADKFVGLATRAERDADSNYFKDYYCSKSEANCLSNPGMNLTHNIMDIDFYDTDGEKNRPCIFEDAVNKPIEMFSGARYVIYNNSMDIKIVLVGTTLDNVPMMCIASYDGSNWSDWKSPILQTV